LQEHKSKRLKFLYSLGLPSSKLGFSAPSWYIGPPGAARLIVLQISFDGLEKLDFASTRKSCFANETGTGRWIQWLLKVSSTSVFKHQ